METDDNPTLKALYDLLCHVKISDIEKLVLPFCFDLTWDYLAKKIQSKQKDFTSSNIAKLILKWLEKNDHLTNNLFSQNFLGYLHLTLTVHYNFRVSQWFAYKLKSKLGECTTDTEIFQSNVDYFFGGTNHKCYTIIENNKVWLHVCKKDKLSQRGTIFVHSIGTKYMFGTKTNLHADVRQKIPRLLNFGQCEPRPLSGKDLVELDKIIDLKKQRALTLDKDIKYEESLVFPSVNHIRDFTRKRNRIRFANDLFGEEPPVLTKLKIKRNGMTAEFKSDNVLNLIKDCIVNGTIKPNAPWLMHVSEKLNTEYDFDDDDDDDDNDEYNSVYEEDCFANDSD